MASDSSAERKAALRAGARGARGHDRREAARLALANLLGLEELARARVAALYRAIGDEVPVEDAADACRARDGIVVYPIVVGPDLELGPEARLANRMAPDEVDVFIVPGVLFDHAGRRLGRGGGHYDRLLARRRRDAPIVGICYADRVVETLPEDPWDVRMSCVVTDRFVLRC